MIRHTGKPCVLWAVLLLLSVMAQTSGAVQYRLQVANLEEKLFFRYVETQGAPLHAERHVLPRLEADLDQAVLPVRVLLSDYHVRSVPPAVATTEHFESVVLQVTPPERRNPWMMASWEGKPGKAIVLQLRSDLTSYQELIGVAVRRDGMLRRLPVQGIPLFGRKTLLAPALSSTYLDHALDRGVFGALVARHAVSPDGLFVVVGRHHDAQYSDTVYLFVRMPPEAKTYKVVLAWKNRDSLEKDGDRDKGPDHR